LAFNDYNCSPDQQLEENKMVQVSRMKTVSTMAGEIIERGTRIKRIEYGVRPSVPIDIKDVKSLREAKYCVQYGNRSEWLDIEELAVLTDMVAQLKNSFEGRGSLSTTQGTRAKAQVNVSREVPDEIVLLVAAKTAFSPPQQMN
jgi:hypothetical protein